MRCKREVVANHTQWLAACQTKNLHRHGTKENEDAYFRSLSSKTVNWDGATFSVCWSLAPTCSDIVSAERACTLVSTLSCSALSDVCSETSEFFAKK